MHEEGLLRWPLGRRFYRLCLKAFVVVQSRGFAALISESFALLLRSIRSRTIPRIERAIFDARFYRWVFPECGQFMPARLHHWVVYRLLGSRLRSPAQTQPLVAELRAHCERIANSRTAELPEVTLFLLLGTNLRLSVESAISALESCASRSVEVLILPAASNHVWPPWGTVMLEALEPLLPRNMATPPQSIHESLAYASGTFFLFIGADTRCVAGACDELVTTLSGPNASVMAGAQTLSPGGTTIGGEIRFNEDGAIAIVGQGTHWARSEFGYLKGVAGFVSACVCVRAKWFREAGAWNPSFHEIDWQFLDLAMRARQSGFDVLYQPVARVVMHQMRAKLDNHSPSASPSNKGDQFLYTSQWKGSAWQRPGAARRCVLIADHSVPRPDSDAGSVTTDNWISIFQGLGYHVVFFACQEAELPDGKSEQHYIDRLQRRGIEVVESEPITHFLERLAIPLEVAIIVRYSTAAKINGPLRQAQPRCPVILLTMDLHFLREQREAEMRGSKLGLLLAEETKRQELAMYAASDLVCTHSLPEEAVIRQHLPQTRTIIAPLVLQVERTRTPFEARRDICFLGGFHHTPNPDAVQFFYTEVWPKIRQKLPGVRFLIAGSGYPAEFRALYREGAEFLGFVEDLRPLFESLRLTVAPLRFGAGVKGKVGTSMGYGVPVVGTDIAFEGMNLANGTEVLVGNMPAELVEATVRAYSDSGLWQRLSNGGYQRAMREYSMDANTLVVREALALVGVRDLGNLRKKTAG